MFRLRPHLGSNRLLHDVVRNAEMGRARLARGHRLEGCPQRAGNLVRAVERPVPLRQRPEERGLIKLGQRIAAARGHRHVGGDRQHRRGGFVRLHHARQDVGRAAAARAFTHADLARHPGVGVGHIGGAALVAREHMGHAVIQPGKRVVERQAGVAAQPEDVPHAIGLQSPHQRFRARHLIHGGTPICIMIIIQIFIRRKDYFWASCGC